jgi:hypothetical protein
MHSLRESSYGLPFQLLYPTSHSRNSPIHLWFYFRSLLFLICCTYSEFDTGTLTASASARSAGGRKWCRRLANFYNCLLTNNKLLFAHDLSANNQEKPIWHEMEFRAGSLGDIISDIAFLVVWAHENNNMMFVGASTKTDLIQSRKCDIGLDWRRADGAPDCRQSLVNERTPDFPRFLVKCRPAFCQNSWTL